MIVVVSFAADEHARAVMDALGTLMADGVLLDLAEFPQRSSLSLSYEAEGTDFRLTLGERELRLGECGSVWWRRPGSFLPHPAVRRPSHVEFVHNECAEAFRGLWHTLDAAWMNHPSRDEIAGRKVLQLHVAREVGLEVPRTLITSDPERARSFIESLGSERVVYKAFSATPREWRETRLLTPQELELLESVRYAPVIFQEYVDAEVDLRVTIVKDDIYAAAIHSQATSYPVDFRMDMLDAKVEPVTLPQPVTAALCGFMDRLGLVYGAIDMRRTPDGRYVFLEINPAGQWLFIEERTGQPITHAIARRLIEMDGQRPAT